MSSLHNTQLSELIGSIYESATDPQRWCHFLERLARATSSSESLSLMHNAQRAEHTVTSFWGSDPASLRLYQERYAALDLWTERAYSMPLWQVATPEALWPLPELTKTEYYNEFLCPINIKHAMFGLVANQSSSLANISLFRDPKAGEFVESDLHLLQLLVPHLQRAFGIHFRFSGLDEKIARYDKALDMLTFGVLILDLAKSILFMNQRARKHVSSGDGLRIRAGEILLGNPSESAQLQSLIDGATKTAIGRGISAGGTMLASRHHGPALCLTIAPLRSGALLATSAAVIFIADPSDRTELPSDLLRRCYGLAAAECRLVLILIEGHSLSGAADLLHVTLNTAKTQLKSVFAKTEVRRHAELVALLLRCGFSITPSAPEFETS